MNLGLRFNGFNRLKMFTFSVLVYVLMPYAFLTFTFASTDAARHVSTMNFYNL